MSAPIHLPDCTQRTTGPMLSARQRRELIRVLAEDGLEGMEAWIEREAQSDPRIRERVERERERLQRQARRKKRQLEAEHEEEKDRRETRWQRQIREMREREDSLRGRLSELDTQPPSTEELAASSDLFRAAFEPEDQTPSRWERTKRTLYRAWLWIVETWTRFIAWLRGDDATDREAPTITVAGDVQLDLYDAMATNPGIRVKVRERIKEQSIKDRVRSWWRRLTGREDYGDIARELMAQELEDAQKTIQAKREREKDELEAQLEEVSETTAEARRRKRRSLEELERQHTERVEELEHAVEKGPVEDLRETLMDELEASGLVSEEGTPTERLLERFSALLYEDVRRALPRGGRVQPGAFLGGEGEYEKHQIRSLNERGNVALVDSVIRSRQNHPGNKHLYDSDLLVHREVRANTTHVVLIFDRSGSMEEKGRFEAAKKVCLVMHQAVKDADPRHRVDLLSMATEVEHVDLEGTWNAELGGFTNHPAAIRRARELLERVDADRRLIYLITDGLPEAYTDEDGEVVVDAPEVCMPYAKREAEELRDVPGTRLLIIQLETEDELYVEAAAEIAEAAGGRVEALDPEELAETIVLDFEAEVGDTSP